MALSKRPRAKSAKERRVIHEYSPSHDTGKSQEFIIGHYLESLHNTDKKMKPKSSEAQKTESKLRIKRFGSQPSLYDARSKSQNYAGKVANRSLRDMGAYAWTPLATRTAVGYGENPYAGVKKAKRPESAPNHRMRRSGSLNSLDTMSSSSYTASLVTSHASSRKRSKKGYMEEPVTLCVRAFPNGSREKSVRVTSKTLAQLLEEATEKLSLPSAGRKIFLPDGTPVSYSHQLYKDCSIYISMGEPFKDPYEVLRDKEKIRLSSSWTISGIMLPEEKINSKKTSLSKRMKSLLENPKHRVLVFRNGESREGVEIVANRFDELLNDCTRKLGLTSSARNLYDWQGKEIQSFQDLSKSRDDIPMQTSLYGAILGPLWAAKGEQFNPTGAFEHFMGLAIDVKQRVKKEGESLENFQKALDAVEDKKAEKSMTKVEIENEIAQIKSNLSTLKPTLKGLKARLKIIKKNCESEIAPKIIENNRLVDTKGYRLKLRLNGSESSNAVLMPFSTKDLRKGKSTKEEVLQSFFDLLSGNQSLKECFIGHGRRGEFKRAFLLNGTEINDVSDIGNDAEVWLSLGEDFVPIEYEILGFSTDTVKCISYWNEKSITQRLPWLGADERLAKPSLWSFVSSIPTDSEANESLPESSPENEKLMFVQRMNNERVRDEGTFLQNKKDPSLILYPELQLIRKGREQDTDLWGEDAREWILSQDGTITNKCFKNLVLSVGEQAITIDNNENKVKGFAVSMALKKMTIVSNGEGDGDKETRWHIDPHQQWTLTPDGQIMSAVLPEFYLTSISELNVEVPQPVVANQEPEAKKSSSSSSSGSESSLKIGEGDAEKMESKKMKKKRKKKGKGKEDKKKKWWNFGSSSSSDSSDEDSSKEYRKSSEDIKVRMKGTSSEDDRTENKSESEKEKIVNEENGLEAVEETKDEEKNEEVVKTAAQLLQEMPDVYGGEKFLLGVFSKFGDKDPMKIRQRWAVKTADAASLISSATLSEKWARQELAWPVNEANTWLEDAVVGYLLPCAPKLKRKVQAMEKKYSPFYGQPARLKVSRNGEHDTTRTVTVIGPDLSNMTRKVQASLPLKWKKSKGSFQDVQAASVTEVEFEQFLDKCTDSLGLPFAARRLFDETGKELTSVNTLKRDQLVYVSCGENWIDPHVTYSEQQRRLLLANLASDVSKIRNYVMLREQSDLILKVEGQLQAGSRIILAKRPSENELNLDEESESTLDQLAQENEIRDLQNSYMTSHQIAHMKSEERMQSIRERFQYDSAMISNKSTIDEAEDESPFSNPSLARKFSRSMEPAVKLPPNAFYEWTYNDGFIHLKANKKLVIGVQQNDESSTGQDVILCNKKVEDSFQRWVISDLGFIHLKCNPQLVFNVATPALQTDPFSDWNQNNGFVDCRIILGRRFDCYNGNSHQMFDVEDDTGLLNAFSTDLANTEITAAIKASVCTYSIFGSRKIHQPGYSISEEIKAEKGPALLCESCGKAVRGKLKLQKIQGITEFACAMGSPEKFGITTTGSFKCLSNQIDLSQREAESTLLVWEGQLRRLQKESSVRVIAYELNLAKTTPSVRLLVHRNGDIGYSEGVVVIANSINQFLDLCTYKLGLTQAARKLYTMKGELITDMIQLLQPYYPELCLPIQKSNAYELKKTSQEETDRQEIDRFLASTPKQPPEVSSAASDATFTIPSRDGTPSVQSMTSEKRVSFANIDIEKEEEEVPEIEKMDVRIPIDVWVSCGEPFIPFEDSEKLAVRASQDREERARVADYLEQEKHRLRQLQGRRFAGRTSTQGSDATVRPVLSKVWDQPSKQEEILEKSIEDLQLHLSELKTQQEQEHLTETESKRPKSGKLFDRMKERKLYDLPRGLSILVYPNGEHWKRAVPVVASNFTELLDRATSRLDLNSVARRAFTTNGDEIDDFDQIEKSQLVCVTCGEKFVPNRERRQKIEMRASWSRSHRGNKSTSETVSNGRSETTLALPAPPSPIMSRNSPVIRQLKHEEILHMFDNNNSSRQSSPDWKSGRPTSSRPSPARPTSTLSTSAKPVSSYRQSSEEKPSRPTTARPTFVGPRSPMPATSSFTTNSHVNTNGGNTNTTSKRPISARPTPGRRISSRPTSGYSKSLQTSKNVKSTVVKS